MFWCSSATPAAVADAELLCYTWSDVPEEEEMGPRGDRGTFINKQGLKLASYWWPAKDPKGVVVVVHGHAGHLPYEYGEPTGLGKYRVYRGSWMERWNEADYSVCGIDQQSHGRSEGLRGLRCYFERFPDLVNDQLDFLRCEVQTRDGYRDLPIFMCGASMGGCVTVNAMRQLWGEKNIAGAVLLAPMLTLERVSNTYANMLLRPFSALLNLMVPTWALVPGKPSIYPEIEAAFHADPYTYHLPARVRVACEYLRCTAQTVKAMPEMVFDFISFHSENDGLTDPEGSKKLYRLSQAEAKTLSIVNHMWHNLTREPGAEDLQQAIISWTDGRLNAKRTIQ